MAPALHHALDGLRVEAVAHEVRAAAVPGLHQSLDLQDDDGLLHGGAAHSEAGGQVALGREAVTGAQAALGDVGAQPVEDLLVQARPGRHRPQCVGHGALLPGLLQRNSGPEKWPSG